MPQKTIDGSWEASHKVNLAAWVRRLDELELTTEQKRRFLIEHHEETLALQLDMMPKLTHDEVVSRFAEYWNRLPSLETIARSPRAQAKLKRKRDLPVGFDLPDWYPKYLQTPHWDEVKKLAIAHYKHCKIDGKTDHLVVHHCDYNRMGRETVDDVCVFCADCHNKITRHVATALRVPPKAPPEVKRLLKAYGY